MGAHWTKCRQSRVEGADVSMAGEWVMNPFNRIVTIARAISVRDRLADLGRRSGRPGAPLTMAAATVGLSAIDGPHRPLDVLTQVGLVSRDGEGEEGDLQVVALPVAARVRMTAGADDATRGNRGDVADGRPSPCASGRSPAPRSHGATSGPRPRPPPTSPASITRLQHAASRWPTPPRAPAPGHHDEGEVHVEAAPSAPGTEKRDLLGTIAWIVEVAEGKAPVP